MDALPIAVTAGSVAVARRRRCRGRPERAAGRASRAPPRTRRSPTLHGRLEASEAAAGLGRPRPGLDGGGRPPVRGRGRHEVREPGRRGAARALGRRRSRRCSRSGPAASPTGPPTSAPRSVSEAETGAPARVLRGFAAPADDGSVVLVLRDITETRRLDQVRRDFVANASHELKTPAASIQAAAETIRTAAGEDPSVIPRFAAQLEREAARLSRIVSDLLDLSRLESGSALDEAVALDAIVRDEGERFEEPAAEAGVGLSVAGRRRPARARLRLATWPCWCATWSTTRSGTRRPGGKVDVELTSDDGEVVLAIVDTGLGIPQPRPAPDLRALLPGGPRAVARDRRDRARPVDRQARRREPRRSGRGDERARAGDPVRGAVAGVALTVRVTGRGTRPRVRYAAWRRCSWFGTVTPTPPASA